MRKLLFVLAAAVAFAGLLLSGGVATGPQAAHAVSSNDATYGLCGRVFPDPHAYWPSPLQSPARSPFAKGNAVCAAADFLQYGETVSALAYLESLFPQFIELYRLEGDFGDGSDCAQSISADDLCSAGLPRLGSPSGRVRSDLYLVRVTDERVAQSGKKLFIFPLGMHGIERAGVEAGTRAAEDLATWAYCEAVGAGTLGANGRTNCAQEGAIPHPLMETQGESSISAGAALERAAVYLMFPNPDGWRRGDIENLARFYQRYNGNGVDLNRDWPTIGYTFRPYTPLSEPESKGFAKVLKGIRSKWDGGIDLHGQLIDRAFSFTLLGAGEHDYAKNQRVLQTARGAWTDAETRLSWSPLIKPNSAPKADPRMYGVQWGTVWDTIDYTVTGALGDWIDSPLGLGADGLDNEMSFSHLINCGVGSCYLPDAEQLHVDGNKSLIYSMVNFTLLPEDTTFRAPGNVGYVHSPKVVSNPGVQTKQPRYKRLSPQPPIVDVRLSPANSFTYEFTILGPTDGYYSGGVEGKLTTTNVGGIGAGSLTSLVLERLDGPNGEPSPQEEPGCGTQGDSWSEVNRYFNQSSIYLQSGQAVHGNLPVPGRYRICLTDGDVNTVTTGFADLDITFSREKAWNDPGQLPYTATNMNFFVDLKRYMEKGQLVKLTASDVLAGTKLAGLTSLVIADDAVAGAPDPAAWGAALKTFVEAGGDLVLTDGALQNLAHMGVLPASAIKPVTVYAGYIGFTRDGGTTETYSDPLAKDVNQPGAAEGDGHRHQTYEPVPLGYAIQDEDGDDLDTSPTWTVDQAAWEALGGRTVGTTTRNRVSLGELALGKGVVRIIGPLLPMPTEEYDHTFGLSDYSLTYTGYQVLQNTLQWTRP